MSLATTNGRNSAVGPRHSANAAAVLAALHSVGRNLLGVDGAITDLPLRQLKMCTTLYHKSLSMSEIARELGMSPSAVTQVSDRLEARDLVERVSQDGDRRRRKLRLTRKGEQLVSSHRQRQLRRISAALCSLSQGEVDHVLKSLEILAQNCPSSEARQNHRHNDRRLSANNI